MCTPTQSAEITPNDMNKIIFYPLKTLFISADTGAMTPNSVSKLAVMVKRIICILAKANFPLKASVCLLAFNSNKNSIKMAMHRP